MQAPLSAYAVLYGNQGNVKRACVGCDADITGKGTAYYHCARPPPRLAKTNVGGVDVCGRCFSAGKLPDGTTSGSFLRSVATGASSKKAKKAARVVSVNEDGEEYEVEDDEDDDDSDAEMEQDDWTDQETLLLLEALETRGESWSDVASHVGTKSAEECIRRFIRLPIEERFLDELDPNVGGEDAADVRGGGDVGSTEEWRMGRPDVDVRGPNDLTVPFAGAPNPVMSNVAFLATCVTPRVAAAAAKAALHALDEENKGLTEKGAMDAMDVDGGGGGGGGGSRQAPGRRRGEGGPAADHLHRGGADEEDRGEDAQLRGSRDWSDEGTGGDRGDEGEAFRGASGSEDSKARARGVRGPGQGGAGEARGGGGDDDDDDDGQLSFIAYRS